MSPSLFRAFRGPSRGVPSVLAAVLACGSGLLHAQPAAAPAPRVLSSGAAVSVAGTMGDRVVLIVDGRTRVAAAGEVVDGRVLRRSADRGWVLEAGIGQPGQPLGERPVRVGAAARLPDPGARLVLEAGSDRLFRSEGEINGRAVSGVVDTGASVMVLPAALARRLGIATGAGSEVDVQTAAGRRSGRQVRLEQVRLGPLQARAVDAVIVEVDLPYVLFGNSFLQDFRLQWEQGRLTLSTAVSPSRLPP